MNSPFPGVQRRQRFGLHYTYTGTHDPFTPRVARAERAATAEEERRDARALLSQLDAYRERWPERAEEFEAEHRDDIERARALLGV